MKKQLACLLAASMLLGLTACGGGTASGSSSASQSTGSASAEGLNADAKGEFAELMSQFAGIWTATDFDEGEEWPDYSITLYSDGTLEFMGAEGTWSISETEEREDGHICFYGSIVLNGTEYNLEITDFETNYQLDVLDSDTYDYFTADSGEELNWLADKEELEQSRLLFGTETVELTMDNFFDYFELKTIYATLVYGDSISHPTGYVLKDEYDGRLVFPEGSEKPEITVALGETEGYPARDRTASLWADDYNYPFFFIEDMSAERDCTLTAVSGSLTISDTAAEVVRPVVEEVADLEPVVLADTGAIRVTLTGMTRITAECGEEEPAQECIYEIQTENLNNAYTYSVEFKNSEKDYLGAVIGGSNEASCTESITVDGYDLSDTSVNEFTVTVEIKTEEPNSETSVEATLPW